MFIKKEKASSIWKTPSDTHLSIDKFYHKK